MTDPTIKLFINMTGKSFSVYGPGSFYMGMIMTTGGENVACSYTPPDCRLGCAGRRGCKGTGPCQHPDKAHLVDTDPQKLLIWLCDKHKMKCDAKFSRQDMDREMANWAALEQGLGRPAAKPIAKWSLPATTERKKAPRRVAQTTPPPAPKPVAPTLTLEEAMEQSMKEAGLK